MPDTLPDLEGNESVLRAVDVNGVDRAWRDVNRLNHRVAVAHKAIRERYDAERAWVRHMALITRHGEQWAAARLSDIAGNETLALAVAERRIRSGFAEARAQESRDG